jgi:diguanylate cyclase (GGDEF)-like protein
MFVMFKKWLKNIIYAGYVDEGSADVRKQIIISSLFSLVSFVLLIGYGIENISSGEMQLATVVLFAAIISGGNYLFLCKTGNYSVASLVILLMMTLLCLYLLCSGGSHSTGPLWTFVLPSLIFYILGLFRGFLFTSIVFVLVVYILLFPENGLLYTDYSTPFIQRFLGAFFSVCVLSIIYEYSREDGRRELLNLSRRLDYLSRKDELTGLSNRRDMFENLRNELGRLERSGKNFSVLIADIDNFKLVNDTHGHECGDHCLKEIAKVLTENTQKRDSVARWGGEEFLIFLPETSGQHAKTTAERLRVAIQNQVITCEENSLSVTASIGVAEYQPGQTLNALINQADKQLYLAKNKGRNRVEMATA